MGLKKYCNEFGATIKVAVPVVISLLGHTLVVFIDNIMVGQLGVSELAAISLGNSFMLVSMSLIIGFSVAITPMIAEADSQKNYDKKNSVLRNGILLCFANGLLFTLATFIIKFYIDLMGQPEEVVALAIPFLNVVIISLIPLSIFQGLKQFTDGLHYTKYAMYATFLGNIINVILNYLFIFGKFGFPRLEIVGAGIGTLVSRTIMVLYMWILISYGKRFKRYQLRFNRKNHFSWKVIRELLQRGIPNSMQMFFEVALFTSAVWISGILGVYEQAANQIVHNLSSMTYMVALGLGTATMVRVGKQKGLGNYVELRTIAFSIFLLTIIIDICFAVLLCISRNWLPIIYLDDITQSSDANVLAIAGKLLLVVAFFQIFDGLQAVILGALRGIGDNYIPTILTFISYWIVGFGIAFYLSLHTTIGVIGIWIGFFIGLICSSLLLIIRFNRVTKKNINTY